MLVLWSCCCGSVRMIPSGLLRGTWNFWRKMMRDSHWIKRSGYVVLCGVKMEFDMFIF